MIFSSLKERGHLLSEGIRYVSSILGMLKKFSLSITNHKHDDLAKNTQTFIIFFFKATK